MIFMNRKNLVFAGFFYAAGLVAGCGGAVVNAPAQVDEKLNFTLLFEVISEKSLPFRLASGVRQKQPCFETVKNAAPSGDTEEVMQIIRNNRDPINTLISSWFMDTVVPEQMVDDLSSVAVSDIESPVALKLPQSALRFVDDQACVEADVPWPDPEVKTAATLFGATGFQLASEKPLDKALMKRLKKAAKAKHMKLEYQDPPPEALGVTSFAVQLKKPIFFGYRELSGAAWRNQDRIDECNLYLIWNDAIPQRSACDFFDSAGFSIRNNDIRRRPKQKMRLDQGELSIEVTSDKRKTKVKTTFGERTMVQANDRLIVWVTAVEAEEGATLKLSGLLLDPRTPDQQDENVAADGSIIGDPEPLEDPVDE
jgi:hypothetical protein